MAALSASVLSQWAPVVAYMAALFYGSSASTLPPQATSFSDTTLHIAGYLGLAVLVARALGRGLRRLAFSTAVLTVMITVAYGGAIEVNQMFRPGRSAEWRDLLSDAVGALAGVGACWVWARLRTVSARQGIISRVPGSVRGSSRDEL